MRQQVPEWQVLQRRDIKHLERAFRFADSRRVLDFTSRAGEQAEEERPHPALLTE